MSRYYIGTAGWSYEDWEGIVYPARHGTPASILSPTSPDYIDIVEVNSTFYRPPSLAMSLSWVKKVDAFPGFLFAVKLHPGFHAMTRRRGRRRTRTIFKQGIEPIAAAGRLAALLIQFPWSYREHAGPIQDILSALFRTVRRISAGRSRSAIRPGTPRVLRPPPRAPVGFCNIDQPVIGNSLRPSAVATKPDFSYVRLHGRNYRDWFRKDAGRDDRYNYLYAKDELEEWIEQDQAARQNGSDQVFVITNNHYRGQAMANALQIKNMITGEKLDIPGALLQQYPVLGDIVEKSGKGQTDLFEGKESGTARTGQPMTWWENEFVRVRGSKLYLGGRDRPNGLARQHGTPLYVYGRKRIPANYGPVSEPCCRAWPGCRGRILLCHEGQPPPGNPARCSEGEGAWIDAVSPTKLRTAMAAGFPPGEILFTGTSAQRDGPRAGLRRSTA